MKFLYLLAALSLALSLVLFIPQYSGENLATPDGEQFDPPEELSEPKIHWHTQLNIMVNGMDIPIPAGVGLKGKIPEVQHTHDWDNVIHIETNDNITENFRLGKFFDIWGVVFNSTCLFQFCHEDLHIYVNGEETADFDNYLLKDQDIIQIEVNV